MRHFEKSSEKEGSAIGNHGTFFSRDLYTIGKLWTKFQLYNLLFPEIIQFNWTNILWIKIAHRSEIFGLLSDWVNIYQIHHVIFGNKIQFFFNFSHHSSISWEITLLYFFSWNFIWFLWKEPIKVQNFRKFLMLSLNFTKW